MKKHYSFLAFALLPILFALTSPLKAVAQNGPTCTTYANRTTDNGLENNTILGLFALSGPVSTSVYAATNRGLGISTDGGNSFVTRLIPDGLGSNTVNDVFVLNNTIYAATDGGLSISTNGGTSFTNVSTSSGLGNISVKAVYALSGPSSTTVYAATAGGLSISTNGGASFTNRTTSSGLGSNAVNDVFVLSGPSSTTIYAATTGGLGTSTNGGTSFTNRTTSNGLGSSSTRGVYVTGGSIYVTTSAGLSISTNGGTSFSNRTQANSGLGNVPGNPANKVFVLGSTVYVAVQGGLSISTDGGTTFTNYTTNNGLGNNYVSDVYVADDIIYAATNGGVSFCDNTIPLVMNLMVSPNPVCLGNSYTITADISNLSGSYSYTLITESGANSLTGVSSNPAFSQTLTAATTGFQTFTLTTSANGKTSWSSGNQTISASPVAGLINNGPLTCTLTSVTLTASGGDSYRFTDSNGIEIGTSNATNTRVVSSAGEYTVQVFNSSGCSSTTTTTVTSNTASGQVSRLYVKASATGANTGLSWQDAFPDLQSALNYVCAVNLTEIWVAGGVYKPTKTTTRTISFALKNGVAIYGGFLGTETALNQRPSISLTTPSSSTLSGDVDGNGTAVNNSYHVINNPPGLTSTALLDGFVIAGGNANGTTTNNSGGGMYNDGTGSTCTPLIRNCLFLTNAASSQGGAVYNNNAVPQFINCYFLTNTATARGGGIYNISNSSPVFTNCVFQSNTGGSTGGGAVYNDASGTGPVDPVFINCLFTSNSATDGGAVYNNASSNFVNPRFVNCSFQSNSASSQGGVVYNNAAANFAVNPLLTNCSFQSNSASSQGSVIYSIKVNTGNVVVTLANCVFFGNGGIKTLLNSGGTTVSASYSLFETGTTGYTNGGNNLVVSVSPFASTTGTQLGVGSPAIDAGDDIAYQNASGPDTDLAGNIRTQNGTIDMGAYESPQPTDLTPIIYARPTTVRGTQAVFVVVDLFEVNSVATSGPITVRLTKDPKVTLSLDGTLTTVGGKPVQNNVWTLSGPAGGYYTLTTNQVIMAGEMLSFGLIGTLQPGATNGTLTATASLVAGSGGETYALNNTDADKIEYFQQ
ncbi:beta strand repeat-containing protein [Spirosoma koreense]